MKLTSPNYPEPYDKLEDCTWNITAPSGHFVTLDFEIIHVSDKDIPILPTILLSTGGPRIGRSRIGRISL